MQEFTVTEQGPLFLYELIIIISFLFCLMLLLAFAFILQYLSIFAYSCITNLQPWTLFLRSHYLIISLFLFELTFS